MSSRTRVFALAGLGAIVLLGGGFLLLGRGSSSAATPRVIKPLHPRRHSTAHVPLGPPKLKNARNSPAKPAHLGARSAIVDGVPMALSAALAKHPVVVVSLVAKGSAVDAMAAREADAGARSVGAGYVAIDVAQNQEISALATLVASSASPQDRLLDDPALLVFQRPHTLFVRINGYLDAATVAQAAANAMPGPRTAASQ